MLKCMVLALANTLKEKKNMCPKTGQMPYLGSNKPWTGNQCFYGIYWKYVVSTRLAQLSFYFWKNQHVQHKSSRKLGIKFHCFQLFLIENHQISVRGVTIYRYIGILRYGARGTVYRYAHTRIPVYRNTVRVLY